MVFEFQLLNLLMMFLLVGIYYMKKDSFSKGNKVYRANLMVTYIIQLVGFGLYIANEVGNSIALYSKVYIILINVWFGLLAVYYVLSLLKNKYEQNMGKYKVLSRDIIVIFTVIQVIAGIATLLGPVPISYTYSNIDYSGHFTIYFICFYLVLEFIVLLLGVRKIDKKSYKHLVVILVMEVLMVFFQARGHELCFYQIGIILVMFYSYFMLENVEKEEAKQLKLERDYAMRQAIEKHEFLKVLSHEIRTPLNTIDGFSQVILDSDDTEEIKSDVKDIRAASKDLIDVINGMIDLSILESGKLEIIEENYNVYDMFDNVVEITESKMRDKSVEFKVDIDKDIPEVLLGDSERISQVILNLITNAIKFTDKGSIELKVQSVRAASKCRLRVSVKDTGRGIKKENLGTIFEQKGQREGFTLGLAVSKHLTELMGGAIEVDSVFGEGSTFVVTIDQKIISEHQEEKVSKAKVLRPFKATGKRVLLVDDNKLNLKVATKLLQPYDVEVLEVQSGKDCLEVLEKDKEFDLILMDDLMPEMSGTECLDVLKKIERVDGFYIPVVVLTANVVSGMKEKYLNAGFEDYLAKPIDKYELDRILKKYLKDKK